MMCCEELERAPEWDGHTPAEAIKRLESLRDIIPPAATQGYRHYLEFHSAREPVENVIKKIETTSWALETSDVGWVIRMAESGFNGNPYTDDVDDVIEGRMNIPYAWITQRDPSDYENFYELEYRTCSGANKITVRKVDNYYSGAVYTVVWEVVSGNPPSESTAVQKALENGWWHNGTTVNVSEQLCAPGDRLKW